ncbi:hypothetical protein KSP39_PZI007968 [Platanthera zijinensis]|uniref:Uncharacterized protein n=1 Tax=Platanthera zijinensis TaxID=2320716 RepID=A0AAP0BP29_9ASPA
MTFRPSLHTTNLASRKNIQGLLCDREILVSQNRAIKWRNAGSTFFSQENLMPYQVPGSNPNLQGSLKVEKLIQNQIEAIRRKEEGRPRVWELQHKLHNEQSGNSRLWTGKMVVAGASSGDGRVDELSGNGWRNARRPLESSPVAAPEQDREGDLVGASVEERRRLELGRGLLLLGMGLVGSSSIRRGRGVTTGRSIKKAILENDKKLLEIEFPKGFKNPCRYAKHLANGVGVIVRHSAGLDYLAPWSDLGQELKLTLYAGLRQWFKIKNWETNKSVREFMEEMFQCSYTHWRGRLSAMYKGYIVEGKNPRASSPFEWISIENWCQLCDLFESETFKKRSKTNAVNRSHMPFTYTLGSKSYHSRLLEMVNQSPVENFANTHNKNGVFVSETAEAVYDLNKDLQNNHGKAHQIPSLIMDR